ncbi:MAG: hypothetical protein J2P21_30995 [Chloracidobacterium sp.]|nr:hypothetical protein [Chloracidobacterium sp.]
MSRVIVQCESTRKIAIELRRRFKTSAPGALAGLMLLIAYSQTSSVFARQDPTGEKGRLVYVLNITTPGVASEDGARLPDLSSLDIPTLISDSDRLGTAMHLQLPEYTYLQRRLSREIDQHGDLIEHAVEYEAYPIEVRGHQRHVISLISEDGSPVSPKRLDKERRHAAKEIETAERESAPQAGASTSIGTEKYVTAGIGVSQAGEGVWIGVSQFMRQCQFGVTRYDRLDNRDMIALEIHSCAGNDSDPREQYLTRMTGVVWIDVEDKVVARLEAWPRRVAPDQEIPFTRPDAETLVYEQMRLPKGLWVPKRIRLNAIGKAALFNGTDKDMTFEFSHYQRFATEVKDIQQVTLKSNP